MAKAYLANKGGMLVGTKTLYPGMPWPPGQVTSSLLATNGIREVDPDSDEYQAAIAEHGAPPEQLPADGQWEYTRVKVQTSATRRPRTPPAEPPARPAPKGRGRQPAVKRSTKKRAPKKGKRG